MEDSYDSTEDFEIPEEEFCVFGIVYAHAEKADELERLYAETTRMAASEPGTIHYAIGRDSSDKNNFHFFERYAGKQAFLDHVNQPIMKDVVACHRDCKAKFVTAIAPAAAGT